MATPNPDFPAKAIASLLGITTRRLQQLAAQDFIPKSERGMYPLIGAVQGYIKYLKQSGSTSTGSSQHQRLARANATRVEMENLKRAGQYIQRDQVHETLAAIFVELTQALEGIPGRTANEYAGINDAAAIKSRQQDELRGVRTLLADALEQFAESLQHIADSSDSGATSEEEDAGSVGEREQDTATD